MSITAVTGSASGIGAAVSKQLQEAGHTVLGIDRQNADIIADLSTVEGRINAANQVKALSNNKLDGLVCCAGLGVTAPSASLVISVNYFGTTELIITRYSKARRKPSDYHYWFGGSGAANCRTPCNDRINARKQRISCAYNG